MAATKKTRQRQGVLEGMAEEFDSKLDGLAVAYDEAMRERVRQSAAEKEAKVGLIEGMIETGKTRYVSADGIVVDLLNKSNVRVHQKKAEGNGETEGE